MASDGTEVAVEEGELDPDEVEPEDDAHDSWPDEGADDETG